MPMTTIFIGSSKSAESQAKAVVKKFSSATLQFRPWWDEFTAGGTLLDELDDICSKVDGAVLLFSPEAESMIRGKTVQVPNLNVLFEFGYFRGHFRKEKVAILKYGNFYLPSDLGGYIHIFGSKFFKRGAVVQVGKRTDNEFTRWIKQL